MPSPGESCASGDACKQRVSSSLRRTSWRIALERPIADLCCERGSLTAIRASPLSLRPNAGRGLRANCGLLGSFHPSAPRLPVRSLDRCHVSDQSQYIQGCVVLAEEASTPLATAQGRQSRFSFPAKLRCVLLARICCPVRCVTLVSVVSQADLSGSEPLSPHRQRGSRGVSRGAAAQTWRPPGAVRGLRCVSRGFLTASSVC